MVTQTDLLCFLLGKQVSLHRRLHISIELDSTLLVLLPTQPHKDILLWHCLSTTENANMTKVAVVTGSNKGIGFAIVRALCKQFQGDVYMTSRDVGRGHAALEELKKEGLSPKYHQLDINDHASVQKLCDYLKETYGGLDLLVNNAAITYKKSSTAPFSEQAEVTMQTNFFSTLNVCKTLFPILRPHARVSNVAGLAGPTTLEKCSSEKKQMILKLNTIEGLMKAMTEFVNDAKAGKHKENGWPESAFGMSKVTVIAMTIVQQAHMDELGKEDIVINAACPGYVDTDMTSHKGKLTPDQGAKTLTYIALLPENVKEPRGKFLSERKVVEWE